MESADQSVATDARTAPQPPWWSGTPAGILVLLFALFVLPDLLAANFYLGVAAAVPLTIGGFYTATRLIRVYRHRYR